MLTCFLPLQGTAWKVPPAAAQHCLAATDSYGIICAVLVDVLVFAALSACCLHVEQVEGRDGSIEQESGIMKDLR